jgi:hypothetical protein
MLEDDWWKGSWKRVEDDFIGKMVEDDWWRG